ncbi:hypothetical protein [Desulfofundulus thermocisternus]|uniref:hypothetical protein n=1 Tax=Desulfofundulus thermocisternus TaxID=42471 RepID=UPI0019F59E04|nr:hypothetical protein [Desulfofundulus thermocisternus]MBE3586003.1 hypothetical protein [Thermoanaerobacter sp.]MCS5695075.1 hypothetical protein [Desulfofundulus thermocisternus]
MSRVLLAAIARDLLLDALHRSESQPFVVFGTMDSNKLTGLESGATVYFYECD